jgi:hypothetical protein
MKKETHSKNLPHIHLVTLHQPSKDQDQTCRYLNPPSAVGHQNKTKLILMGKTLLHDSKIWLASLIFVYFFSYQVRERDRERRKKKKKKGKY